MLDPNFPGGWSFIFLITFFFSCTKDVTIQPPQGLIEQYFPLEEGDVRTYQVDSITFDFDGELQRIVVDSNRYFIREEVGKQISLHGEPWHRIAVLRSAVREGGFRLVDYVYERLSQTQMLRREGNLTFIVLASPLSLYDEWDGTAYFESGETIRFVRGEKIKPYEEWNYVYLKEWEEFSIAGQKYHDVIQINQRDTASIRANDNKEIKPEHQLFFQLANEFYAPNTGLIKKEHVHLTSICASSSVEQFQEFCDTTTIFQNAERGFIYQKILLSHE